MVVALGTASTVLGEAIASTENARPAVSAVGDFSPSIGRAAFKSLANHAPRPATWQAAAAAADPAALERARLALEEGRPEAALQILQALAETTPTAEVLLWLGHAHRSQGDDAAGSRAYQQAAQIAPEHPQVLVAMGEIREVAGDLRAAIELYERAMAYVPDAPLPYRLLGGARMKLREYDASAQAFEAFLERAPDDLEVLNLLGVARYLGQDYDAAIATLERALAREPQHPPSSYTLGVILADRPADHDRALELLRVAAAAGWDEANASYLIGRILADRADQADPDQPADLAPAIAALERSIELNPDQLDATYRLAQAQARAGDRASAQRTMLRFRELQAAADEADHGDKRFNTLHNEVAAALEARDLPGADAAASRLLEEYPNDPRALIIAAKLWYSTGATDRAAEAVVRALQAAPDDWEALYLRGLMLSRDGRYAEALPPLERSLQSNPSFAATHASLGNTLFGMGDAEGAAAAYRAAVDLEPENSAHHLNLAIAYEQLGQTSLEEASMATYRRLLAARQQQ